MSTTLKHFKDENGKSVDPTLYRNMIGTLLYLTASRPDIMYAVCICARYQNNPKESHLTCVKRIIKYIKGTLNLGLWYTNDTPSTIIGYTDADWAGCTDDSKIT